MGCEVPSCEASAIICKVELKFANLTVFSSLRLDKSELDLIFLMKAIKVTLEVNDFLSYACCGAVSSAAHSLFH